MKKSLAIKMLAAGALFVLPMLGGCQSSPADYTFADYWGPPGYPAPENARRIGRYTVYDFQQAIDDVDIDLLMTRPASTMTKWDLATMD